MSTTLEAARAAKTKLRERLDGVQELRGIGLTKVGDGYAVKVNLAGQSPGLHIEDEIDGVPIIVEVVGNIHPR